MKPLVVNFLALTITICYAPGCRASQPVLDGRPPTAPHANRSPPSASKPTPTVTPTPTASPSSGILTSAGPVQVQIQPSISPSELKVTLKAENQESTPLVVPMQIQATATRISPVTIPIEVSVTVKQVDARSVTPSPEPKNKEEDYIGHISSGDLLTLIVALAAYIGALRFFMRERLRDLRKEERTLKDRVDIEKKLEANPSDKRFPPEIRTATELSDYLAKNHKRQCGTMAALSFLVPCDFLFVILAILLTWRLFGKHFGVWTPPQVVIMFLFGLAILYLGAMHVISWRDARARKIKTELHCPSLRDIMKRKLLRKEGGGPGQI